MKNAGAGLSGAELILCGASPQKAFHLLAAASADTLRGLCFCSHEQKNSLFNRQFSLSTCGSRNSTARICRGHYVIVCAANYYLINAHGGILLVCVPYRLVAASKWATANTLNEQTNNTLSAAVFSNSYTHACRRAFTEYEHVLLITRLSARTDGLSQRRWIETEHNDPMDKK